MKSKFILNFLDSLALVALNIVLLTAFVFQIAHNELPCPLCLMQRMGFYLMAYGLVLNLIKGYNPKHYLLVIIAALFNALISLLQVVLHIVPGSGSFGSPVLGLHMYTWSVIISLIFILYSALAGLAVPVKGDLTSKVTLGHKLIIGLLMLSLIANIVSALLECGPYLCSSANNYWLLDKIKLAM